MSWIKTNLKSFWKYWKAFALLAIILNVLPLVSQAQYVQFSRKLGIPVTKESYAAMQVVNGETYMLGNRTDIEQWIITKLDAAGNTVYTTTLPGGRIITQAQMKVVNGEVYLYGQTTSANFPVTNGSTYSGNTDMFVTRLNTAGGIAFSTYLSGNGIDVGLALDVVNGEIYLLGQTRSTNFPVTNGSVHLGPAYNTTFTKLSATGTILVSEYLAGSNNEIPVQKLEVVGGKAYLIVNSLSSDFPVTDGSTNKTQYGFPTFDMIPVRLDAATGAVEYASYIGGTGNETAADFEIVNGQFYIVGSTGSADFPVTDGSTSGGVESNINTDMVYMRVSPGVGATFATRLGGAIADSGHRIQIVNGEAYLIGTTTSVNFPTTNGSGGASIDFTLYTYARYNAAGQRVVSAVLDITPVVIPLITPRGYFLEFAVANNEVHIASTRQYITTFYTQTGGLYEKLDAATGNRLYSRFFDAQVNIGTTIGFFGGIQVENGLVYLGGHADLNYPVTTNTGYTPSQDLTLAIVRLCGTYPSTPAVVSPASQTICQNGLTQPLTAPDIQIASEAMPTLYADGVSTSQEPIGASYQWQIASSPSGPWTDIGGAIQKDYSPGTSTTSRYFRRISTSGPCCGNTVVNTSATASIIVGPTASPTVILPDVLNTCPGTSVTLGGTPTASGGSTPYTYSWDHGAAGVSNPTVSPTVSTIYTLTVT
ncbi:MAG: hypothetical protein J0I82_33965, partial [Spirosoma sp.]|nr:hypothetical protein [Spirosoma sp.]